MNRKFIAKALAVMLLGEFVLLQTLSRNSMAEKTQMEPLPGSGSALSAEHLDKQDYHSDRRLMPEDSYRAYIDEASALHGVEVAMIKAIIKVESNYDPKARSYRGAGGLMQLMPGLANLYRIDVNNPRKNIMVGTAYYKSMLDRFGGSEQLALAAYNAGPRKVSYYGRIPPYPVTKRYIKKVLAYRNHYNKSDS